MRRLPPIPPLRTWIHLVRQLEALPCNGPGADKTWVVEMMRDLRRMLATVELPAHLRRRDTIR